MEVHWMYYVGLSSLSVFLLVESMEAQNLGILQEWCFVQGNEIQCKIPARKPMDFDLIRDWTKRQNEKLAINIECDEGGIIGLPWPMKAKNLVHLKVLNCRIQNYSRDSYKNRLDREPDFLEHVQVINCAIDKSVHDSVETLLNMKNYSKSYYCGPLKAASVVTRNITINLINTSDVKRLRDSGIFYDLFDRIKNLNKIVGISCDYENLELMDHSIFKSRERFYFKHIVEDKSYPKLKVYNVSCNSLSRFPSQLSNWSTAFPTLEFLDLSHNNFKTFDFASYAEELPARTAPLRVNFQYNRFEAFPVGSLLMLYRQPAVIVDLRNNPILCDCGVKELKEYLLGIRDLYPEYSALMDVKCHLPPNLRGRSVISLESPPCRDLIKTY